MKLSSLKDEQSKERRENNKKMIYENYDAFFEINRNKFRTNLKDKFYLIKQNENSDFNTRNSFQKSNERIISKTKSVRDVNSLEVGNGSNASETFDQQNFSFDGSIGKNKKNKKVGIGKINQTKRENEKYLTEEIQTRSKKKFPARSRKQTRRQK